MGLEYFLKFEIQPKYEIQHLNPTKLFKFYNSNLLLDILLLLIEFAHCSNPVNESEPTIL